MYKYEFGVVGYGNMATAILNGIFNAGILPKDKIIACDLLEEKLLPLKSQQVAVTTDVQEVFDNARYVLLAVKPQSFDKLLQTEKYETNATAIISIMAGKPISTIKNKFLTKPTVVRIMPNTPCLVGEGMSGLVFDDTTNENLINFVKTTFNSIGKTIEIHESQIDNVSSISGSGPAYSYTFISALIKAGMEIGLTYDEAKLLTEQTLLGSIKMLEGVKTISEIDEFTDRVCSKGGSTIEAIKHLRENNFDDIVIEAIKKCKKRNEELAKI